MAESEPTESDRHMQSVLRLAEDRTVFAAERTYAAWVRTGLASLATAVGARTLLKGVLPDWQAVSTASVLAAFSAFCFVAAVWRELVPGFAPDKSAARRLPRTLMFVLNGALTAAALGALATILI